MENDDAPLFDISVEPLVRVAIAAAIGRNSDSSAATLQAMKGRLLQSVYLGARICAQLLVELDDSPDESQIEEWATDFTDMEGWADLDRAEVVLYLKALTNLPRPDSASAETAMRLTFVLAGWLLTAFQWNRDTHWHKLDEVIHLIKLDEEANA